MEEKPLSFSMSEEQQMMKETAAKLVQRNIIENAREMDEKGAIPQEYISKFRELGTAVSAVSEEYGGYGLDYSPVMNSIILEELAAGDMAFAISAALPSLLINTINDMGTDDQKKEYLTAYCDNSDMIASLALCESRIDFDPVSLHTRAEEKNGSYMISGKKCFVPYAKKAEHFIVAARLQNDEHGLFIIPADASGIGVGERGKNLGLNAMELHSVDFDNCSIPVEMRIGGKEGCNYDRFLQKTRVAMGAIGTGVSRASYEYALEYAKERRQFGEPIGSRQSIAFMLAEMAYEVDAMRLLTWKAASLLESGMDTKREAYLLKLYAGDMTMKITDYGVQILGGHGFIRDHSVERYYRNGRSIAVLEGMAMV